MNRTRRLWPVRRLACILAGQAAALLAAVAAARAAFALPVPPWAAATGPCHRPVPGPGGRPGRWPGAGEGDHDHDC
jgi:hypothetical protein